jgi:hypothetical protein
MSSLILILHVTIHQVKSHFQNSVVGICTILPRKGKGPNITKCNDTVLNVNIFFKKLCIILNV